MPAFESEFGRAAQGRRVLRSRARARLPKRARLSDFSCRLFHRRGRCKIRAKANISRRKMPTTSAAELEPASAPRTESAGLRRAAARARLRTFARELSIFAGFCALTALMTWPWVLHLRDAVAD